MDARYVQSGDTIDFRPDRDVAAGAVVVLGSLVGVAKLDVKAGELGLLALTGVFDMKKLPGWSTIGCRTVAWSVERKGIGDEATPGAVPVGHNVRSTMRVADETIPVRLCQGAKLP